MLNVRWFSFTARFCPDVFVDSKLAQVEPDLENSVFKPGLISRVETNDTGGDSTIGSIRLSSQGQEKKVTASHTEKRLALTGKIQSKLASAGRVLRLVSHKPLALTTGLALLLCMTQGGCSGFFINPSLSSIFVTPPSSTIAVNNTVQLIATGVYSDGSQKAISGTSVGWSSSNTAVATVTSPGGLVTGISTGTTTITVTSQGVNTTSTVTVTPTNITTLSITTTQGSTLPQTTATISGAPATLQFYAYGNGLSGNDLTDAVTWTSSNTSVATISSGLSSGNGLATSVAAGTTNISATITNTSSGIRVTSNTIVLTVQ
jgi:Bacterial Ig-like domain (group 2)